MLYRIYRRVSLDAFDFLDEAKKPKDQRRFLLARWGIMHRTAIARNTNLWNCRYQHAAYVGHWSDRGRIIRR